MNCPRCGAAFRTRTRDESGAVARSLCGCDSAPRCAEGKHPATQAHLDLAGGIDSYLCDAHGIEGFATPKPKPVAKAPVTGAPSFDLLPECPEANVGWCDTCDYPVVSLPGTPTHCLKCKSIPRSLR